MSACGSFTVVEDDGEFLGTGGLHIIWEDLAEIRALALVESATRRGIGRQLVAKIAGGGQESRYPPGIRPYLPERVLWKNAGLG